MNMSDLERRYDRSIPARELDAAKYPTKANQIARAIARVRGANRQIRERMAAWRTSVALAEAHWGYDASRRHMFLSQDRAVHMPHLKYWRMERLRWQRHLETLEA